MSEQTARHETPNGKTAWNSFSGWIDDRLGLSELSYPVPAHANNILYTLGGITLFGILLLIASGIYLTQFYNPDPDEARASVEYIRTTPFAGAFIRNAHFWLASLVTITLLLHALRVFATGAYRAPRELNWVLGVGLLAIMLGLVFTGTVLKWDQEGWEALQHNEEVGELLGGAGAWFTSDFTSSTPILQRLFIAHVAILPFLLLAVITAHFFLVKHHGISSPPGYDELRPAVETDTEHAMTREGHLPFTSHLRHLLGWGLLLTLVAGVLAALISAPLGRVIDPGEEETKPFWVFLPLYPFEDWFGVKSLLWLPIIGIISLALVPAIDRFRSSSLRLRWPLLAIGACVVVALVVLAIYAQLSAPAEHIPGD